MPDALIERTSVVAAMILVERGFTPPEAVAHVRQARHNSFCMPEQSDFIFSYQPVRSKRNLIACHKDQVQLS